MGSADFYPEERPVNDVTVDGFWMERGPFLPQVGSLLCCATVRVTLESASLFTFALSCPQTLEISCPYSLLTLPLRSPWSSPCWAASAQTPTPSLKFTFPRACWPRRTLPARTGDVSTQPVSVASPTGEWQFTVYPILAWVPTNIAIDVEGPFDIAGGNGGGAAGAVAAVKWAARFLISASTARRWRAFRRPTARGGSISTASTQLSVAIARRRTSTSTSTSSTCMPHVSRAIAGGFFVTAGVRRFALKYEIDFLDFDTFTSKPGIWDPLVGIAYHRLGDTLDSMRTPSTAASALAQHRYWYWRAVRLEAVPHFGFTAGYSLVSFKFKKDVRRSEFSAKQSVGGPSWGFGLDFFSRPTQCSSR